MAFGQVLVLADQHDRIGPEILAVATHLVRVVCPQPITDAFGFADIGQLPVRFALVLADQDVDAWPLDLGEGLAHLAQLVAAEGDGLDRRHHDLRHPDTVRIAVEKEDVDRAGLCHAARPTISMSLA